jgi:hypothetical protein
MLLEISKQLECGQKISDMRYYDFNDEVDLSKYESFLLFNQPGNLLYCRTHNDQERIRHIHVRVVEFDAREIV